MRLRIEPAAARELFKAELEALGGAARAIGQTLELSYTTEEMMDLGQERVELVFFIRAWLSTQRGVIAEVVA